MDTIFRSSTCNRSDDEKVVAIVGKYVPVGYIAFSRQAHFVVLNLTATEIQVTGILCSEHQAQTSTPEC
jgi:hypothetical protein